MQTQTQQGQKWLRETILRGLLSLQHAGIPSKFKTRDDEVYNGNQWVSDLTEGLGYCVEEIDRRRLEHAFGTLRRTCEWWPAPAAFFKVLPSRTNADILKLDQKQLSETIIRDTPDVAIAALKNIQLLIIKGCLSEKSEIRSSADKQAEPPVCPGGNKPENEKTGGYYSAHKTTEVQAVLTSISKQFSKIKDDHNA